jgi:glycosyltransferase involved in cell wall biosynthesis|tara:strand:+ start:5493 stop:6515 length:1023 start_codon:yes stop_codon:yes gene_type:complete
MKYTLIIAVYNRLDEIIEFLASAEQLEFDRKEFEILFVDDGSNDGFLQHLEDYSSVSGLNFRFITQKNKGPGEARNNGMRNSSSDYFIFNDSDLLYPTNYLRKIDDALIKHDYDAFGGPDDCHPSFSPLLKAINYAMTSFIGTGGTRGSDKSVSKKFYPRSFSMGIKKEVFKNIGGMNQLRHGQDMDFSARIYEAGYKVGLISDAIVYHKRRTSLKRFYKQIFNWGVARINLGKMHEGMLKPVHFLPAAIVLFSILIPISAIFISFMRVFLYIGIAGFFGVLLLAFVQSFMKYKILKTSFLSMITLLIQVYAYGFGTLSGLLQTLKGNKVAKGFTKDYYK